MRCLPAAACLLVPALARPAVEANDDAIPSAFISLHLPPHNTAQARDLTFRFDVGESQSACGIANVTINDQTLHQSASGTGQGSFTSDQGNIIVANWNFTCIEWNGTPQEQFLSLGVDYVDGLAFENVGFVLRFQQTAPVWISDIEGSASMTRAHRGGRPGHGSFSEERESDFESELEELEFLKFQLFELEQIIFIKEQRLAEAFDYRGEKGKNIAFHECDSLKCLFKAAYHHVHDAATSFYSDILGEQGYGMHGHKGPHRPHHPPHCPPPPIHHGNHTHPNGTFPHPPPWAPPPGDHKPPFHPPPFCKCPPPPPPPPPHRGGLPPPHGPDGSHPGRPHEPPHGPPHRHDPEGPEHPPPPPHGKSPPGDKGLEHDELQSFDENHAHEFEDRPHGPPHGPPHGGDHPPPPPPPEDEDEFPILPPDMDMPPPGHGHDGPGDGNRPPKHGHHGGPGGPGEHGPPRRGFMGDALKIGASLILLALLLFTLHFRTASKHAIARRANRHARHARRQSKHTAFFQRLHFWRRNVTAANAEEHQPMMQQRNVNDDDDESDAMSTTMEQEIQQFRAAASMVGDIVAAEEGRAREMEVQSSAALNHNITASNILSHDSSSGNMGFVTLPPLRSNNLPHPAGGMPVTEVHMAQLPPQPTLSQVLPLTIPQPGLGFRMGQVMPPTSPSSAFPEYMPADDSLPAYDYNDSPASSMIADGMMYQPGGSGYSPGSSTGGRGNADEFGDAKPRREQGPE